METRRQLSVPVSTFLVAVITSTWLGGTKPGLLATVLSILGFDYFLLHLGYSLGDHPIDAVRLLSLGIVASYVVWVTATERSAAQSLMRSHDELKRNNEARYERKTSSASGRRRPWGKASNFYIWSLPRFPLACW
jgi:K+-sensing histidine kinase KdpD